MATEAQLVTLFAALVAIAAVILLFVPIVRRAWYGAAGPLGYSVVAAGMLAASVLAVALVTLAASDSAFATPLILVVVALRLASPSLLYLRLRTRLEAKAAWDAVRVAAAILFVGLAAALVVRGIGLVPATASAVVGLSDQILMAVGASVLFLRIAIRTRPGASDGWIVVWVAGLLFGIAFLVVAPYAFPAFAFWYLVSGVAGWSLAAAMAAFVG